MIDLSQLEITTPQMKPGGTTALTVPGSDIAKVSNYVYPTKRGMMFMAPVFGAHTESVHRTRCEWKGKPFKLNSAKRHVNRQKVCIHIVNNAGSVVISQVHDDNSNSPMSKVFWQGGDILTGIRTKRTSTDPKKELLFEDFKLEVDGEVTQELDSEAMTLTVTATQNGRTETVVKDLDDSWLDTELVDHGGAYNQVDMGETDNGDGTALELLELEIIHDSGAAVVPPVVTPTPAPVPAPTPAPTPSPAPAPPPVSDADKIAQEIEAVIINYKAIHKATTADRTAALTALNALSTKVKSLATDEERAPLYDRIKELKNGI